MASTYSNNLRLELIGTGDQAGTWGDTTNNNLGTLIEKAVSGSVSVTVSVANTALTALNGADDQSRNMMLVLDTTTGANFTVYTPPAPKLYIVRNASSYIATIYNSTVLGNTTPAGTGIDVLSGQSLLCYTDGTNFRTINAANLTGTLAVASGGTGSTSLAANNVILGNGTSAVQTVAPSTDNNVLRSDGSTWVSEALGSMADQNSGAVAITGGDITGMDTIAVSASGRISGNGSLPAGAVQLFAMTTPPTGWVECNGGAVSRTTYADLFAAIGTTWGSGDGSTTFNVPDLRGEFVRGWDNGRGVDSGRSFASSQAYAVESHQHAVPSNRYWVTNPIGSDGTIDASAIASPNDRTIGNEAVEAYGGTETRPRNIAMLYCIKT